MAIIETEALILRSYNLSDADRIVVFMTKTDGLVRGVAKGAKRLKSKFSGSLEPFSIVNLTYFQKDERELVAVNNIELRRSFFSIASQIDFLQKFGYLSELLTNFAPPHEPNERLYNMSRICLETASENGEYLTSIVLYFELWVLRLGGYLPVWEACKVCKRQFNESESTNLDYDFHLVCSRCKSSKDNLIITHLHRKIFIIAQQVSPAKFIELSLDNKDDLLAVSGILKRIISQVLGKEIVGEHILAAKL